MSRVARHALVTGRVQGVAFRWSTRTEARKLGLAGWVRNLHDGRVETHFEGEPDDVDALAAWLRRGPPHAHVERLALSDVSPESLDDFEIHRTAPGGGPGG